MKGKLHLARNVIMVGACFAMASLLGMVRNIVIASQFGIGADLDVYYAAFKVPELLFTVVAGGALVTAFLPVLAEYIAGDDNDGAWRLASAVTNIVVLVAGALSVLAALLAPWLIRWVVAPGFAPEMQAETAVLMRIILVSTVLFAVSSIHNSVLNGFQHFLWPALAPVMYPIGIIAGALWFTPMWGVRGLAAGAVLGSAMHLAIKIPGLVRYGFQWKPVLDIRTQSMRRVGVLMAPRVLDLGIFHLTFLVTANLASRLTEGSVSALEWGWNFVQLPETMIGTAFGLVAFPTLSALASRRDIPGLRSTLAESLHHVLALTLPISAAMILLGRPILALLFQRGAFDAASTEAVLAPLRFYALGLVGHSCLELAARAFFAQQDAITPLYIAAATAFFQITLALLLVGPLGAGGLALANSVAISVEVAVLLAVLRKRWNGVGGRSMLAVLGRVLPATLAMSLALGWVVAYANSADLSPLLTLILGGSISVVVYAVAGLLLGIPLLRETLQRGRSSLGALVARRPAA